MQPFISMPSVRSCCRLLLLLSMVLLPRGSNALGTSPTPSEPAQYIPTPQTYHVAWEISASGSAAYSDVQGNTFKERQTIMQSGSATVRTQDGPGGAADVSLYQLVDNMEFLSVSKYRCRTPIDHRIYVTDPARYTGGDLNPETPYPNFVLFPMPVQHEDGSWTMLEPLELSQQHKYFTHRSELGGSSGTCEGAAGSEPYDYEFQSATGPGPFGPQTLQGDREGKHFSMTHTYEDEGLGEIKLAVTRRVWVTRYDQCGGKPAPVDADDPDVDVVDITLGTDTPDVLPDGKATVRARVTCEGIPVKNAKLELGGVVVDRSGGHLHVDANRPRGYLDSRKILLGRMPAATTTVTTDAQGMATFEWEPGRDTKNERIGIAGTYMVWARATQQEGYEEVTLRARVPNLKRLFASGLRHEGIGSTREHPENSWATPTTYQAVLDLSQEFWEIQQENNRNLIAAGEEPWPVVTLWVNDISLPDGGLFDVRGWDAQAGGVRGAPWQPPHYTHTDGTVVDFSTGYWWYELRKLSPERQRFIYRDLRLALRIAGERWGSWAGGPTMTLRTTQHGLAGAQAQATDADVGALALWDGPAEYPLAAPGQTVTYTLGVHNYGDTEAADGVQLTANLPDGLVFSSATPAPTSVAGGQPRWQFGTLPANALPKAVTLVAEVAPQLQAGTVLTVTAQATSSSADATPANNQVEAPGLHVRAPGPDLAVHTDLDALALTPGRPVTFTVDVANWGTVAALGSKLQLTLPTSVTLRQALPVTPTLAAGTLTWNLGSLQPNATTSMSVTVELDGELAATQPAPELLFSLQAGTTNGDSDPSNNAAESSPPVEAAGGDLAVALQVAGTAPDGGLVAGEEMTYTLRYGNYGNQLASTSAVTLSLPSGLSVVQVEPQASRTTTSTSFPGGVLAWELGDLAVGAEGAITVKVRVDAVAEGGALVLATSSTTTDIKPSNNYAEDQRSASAGAPIVTGLRVYLPIAQR